MNASRTGLARRFKVLAAGAIAVAALSACGGSDDPTGSPSETTSPTQTTSESASDPAAGTPQVADLNGAEFSAPADWKVSFADPYWHIDAPGDDGSSPGGAVFDAESSTLAGDTEELAASRLKAAGADGKRLPDVKYGGVDFFHIREETPVNTFETYGAIIDGSEVAIEWTFIKDLASRKQIDDLINQVMPSFKFEG